MSQRHRSAVFSSWRPSRGRRRSSVSWTLGLLLGATFLIPPLAAQEDPGLSRLQNEIVRLSRLAAGRVGVAATHLESGRQVELNGEELFPMASTYKVPIAVQLLTRVDRGEVSLERMIALEAGDLHPGSGTLTELFDDPGVILSLRNLLELMLLISDNSATDLVLEEAGGSAAVNARMRGLGLAIRVDRPTIHLIGDYLGIDELPRDGSVPPEVFRRLAESVDPGDRAQAGRAFTEDPRDTASPTAMTELLSRLWRRQILSEESSALLLDIMLRCRTGANRLKGFLPPATEVFHKTGTVGSSTNDVGIIRLPDGAGHVATAVFVKGSTAEVPERERAIAHIARALHDFFLFQPRPPELTDRPPGDKAPGSP